MLPVEALKYLSALATEAVGRRIVRAEAEPPHVYYVQQPDGTMQRTVAVEPPARHEAADIDTLCRVARDFVSHEPPNVPAVWHHRGGVEAVLSQHAGYAPTCTLTLGPSPQLALLARWDQAGRASLTQAEFVTLLRTMFADCAPADLLPAIRNVKSTKNAEVNSQIAQGKVSLGKSIVAEMTGVAGIPERVAFTVPVFAQAAVPVSGTVRVEIDPDPQNERFTLIVLPGDVEAAYAQAEEAVGRRLVERLAALSTDDHPSALIPVYRGEP